MSREEFETWRAFWWILRTYRAAMVVSMLLWGAISVLVYVVWT
jgi:hypothetical protein